jgi:CubicO group peptidase (beta-lactamase class C family)
MASQNGYDFSATRQFLDRIIDSGAASGISLQVTRKDETILATQTGFADREKETLLTPDTLFRLFSMTKPVTAVLLLMLYERGLVHLNDPVSEYLPGFRHPNVWIRDGKDWKTRPAVREITIHHLLTMTSGIPYHFDEHPASQAIAKKVKVLLDDSSGGRRRSLPEMANALGSVPLCFDPGSSWLYGLSMDVIGAVIEVVAQKTLGEFMKEVLLEPLSMHDTGFFVDPSQQNRLARLYGEKDGKLVPNPDNHLTPGDPTKPPVVEYGGAGLFSTRSDYTRFTRMLLHGGTLEGQRILSPRSVNLMRQNHLSERQMKACHFETLRGYGYGLGVRSLIDPTQSGSLLSPGEFGWDGAAGTWFSVDPSEEMTIVYMVQRLPADHIRFIPRLQATLYAAL